MNARAVKKENKKLKSLAKLDAKCLASQRDRICTLIEDKDIHGIYKKLRKEYGAVLVRESKLEFCIDILSSIIEKNNLENEKDYISAKKMIEKEV